MRPVRLAAVGFTAFRDLVEIDFADADFFALVGPTGSGKSSVLDAICFALYGSVPRYDDDRLVAPAITQGATEARVSLTFEIGGEEYIATRVVRRTKTGATTKEARLEHGSEIVAGDARDMNDKVAELIGLPFHHFTRSVVLPQGDFAEFLHDKPSARQDLIVKLLDLSVYGRMQTRATQRAAEGKSRIQLDEQRLAQLADCTTEARATARARAATLKKLLARLGAAENDVRVLEQASERARAEGEAAGAIVTALAKVAVPKAVRSLGTERAAAAGQQETAASERAAAEQAIERHGHELESLPDPSALQQQLDAIAALEEVDSRVGTVEVLLAEARPELDAEQAALEAATHAVRHAEAEYEVALEDTAATALAAGLKVGAPCPVCEQVVTRKPNVRAGEKVRAKKTLDAARKSEVAARTVTQRHEKARDQRDAELVQLNKQAADLRAKVAGAPPADVLVKQIEAVRGAQQLRVELQRAFQTAVRAERDAREKVEGIDTRVASLRREGETQRDALVSAGLDPPRIGADLPGDWGELARWAAHETPAHERRAKELAELAREHLRSKQGAIAALVAECRTVGIAVPDRPEPTVGRLRELTAAAEQAAASEIERVTAALEEQAAIGKRVASVREEVGVATELARLLRSTGFEQWIVNEALEALVIGASTTLEQLSNGQYALAVDDRNEFEVVDHRNADERRPIKTLSGGETFQASTALALALADQVAVLAAGGAAKLDAIFLDEGFGTLDADSLDTVAATLETLGGDGRMVGIVTHVRELADRVPVRYEVIKGPRTSTVTRVDA
jgi:exonuclease SbcC